MSDRSPRWKVVLVVEDDSDGRAFQALLSPRYGARVVVDWLPANGIGNIRRRGESLIRLARDRVPSGRGCVAVVIDRDGKDPARDEPHVAIAEACRREGVSLFLCREAMEACFLADTGCCRWLGIQIPPRSDTIEDPRSRVSQAFLRKTGRTYRRRRARMEIARQAQGPDPGRNETIRAAWEQLDRCIDPDD